MYLALLSAAPTDATTMATMTEIGTPGTNGYSRPLVAFSAPSGTTLSSTSNTSALTIGPFTGSAPGTATYAALVSANTGTSGELTFSWTLDVPKAAAVGDSITLAVGALVCTET